MRPNAPPPPLYESLVRLGGQLNVGPSEAPLPGYLGRILLSDYMIFPLGAPLRGVPLPKLGQTDYQSRGTLLFAYARSSFASLVDRVVLARNVDPAADFEQRLADRTRKLDEALRQLTDSEPSRRSIDSVLIRMIDRHLFRSDEPSWEDGLINDFGQHFCEKIVQKQPTRAAGEYVLFLDTFENLS